MTARSSKATTVVMDLGALDARQVSAAVEGFVAGNYRYDGYKAEKDRRLPQPSLVWSARSTSQKPTAPSRSLPARHSHATLSTLRLPTSTQRRRAAARELASDRITVDVWEEERIREAGMGIIAVGQGSVRPPRLIHLHTSPGHRPGRLGWSARA